MGISEEYFLSICSQLNKTFSILFDDENDNKDEKSKSEQAVYYIAHNLVDESNGILLSDNDSLQQDFSNLFEKLRGVIRYGTSLSHYKAKIISTNNNEELRDLSRMIDMTYGLLKRYYKSCYDITSKITSMKQEDSFNK